MTLSVAITHRVGDFDLQVEFDAPKGLTVLFGRSGSGKSTVINAVAGLLRPETGRIAVDGHVLQDTQNGRFVPPHHRRLGTIFQDHRLFPHMSVRQNLGYGRRFAPRGAALPEMAHIVEMLALGALLDRRPGDLSGGEKARVAIGRAVLAAPRLILADEPLAALDATRKSEVLMYFERLRDTLGLPILYVSHSPAEVARLATTVVVLDEGRVTRIGQAADVLGDPGVTPLGPGRAGAVITAQVVAHHDDGLTELDLTGQALWLPRIDRAPGTQLRVHVEAQDVMLALDRPTRISAQNILSGVISDIRIGAGPGALIQVRIGEAVLLARVTRRALGALGLHRGQPIYAVLKAVSVAK